MKTNSQSHTTPWASALSHRQRRLLETHNIITDKDYLQYRDSLSISDRNQIDDLRYIERLKQGPFSDIKEFFSFVPFRLLPNVKTDKKLTGHKLQSGINAHIELLKLSNGIADAIKAAPTTGTLVTRVKLYADELFAREAIIWRARMGLLGKRMTLEDIGLELGGISRERVRQIEAKLFIGFKKENPKLIDDIEAALIKLDNDKPIYVDALIEEVPSALVNIENDIAVLDGLLESLNPKHYIITDYATPVISKLSKTAFENEIKALYRRIEQLFRKNEFPMSFEEITNMLTKEGAHPVYAKFATDRLEKHGYVVNGVLLAPDNNYSNIVIGLLQHSDSPIHINDLAEKVAIVSGQEYINPASLRGTLALAPNVKNFGRGLMGLSKHYNVDVTQILNLAKQPMSEDDLLSILNKQDGIMATRATLVNNKDAIEVSPGVWGLATRDHPYEYMDIDRMVEVFDNENSTNLSQSEVEARLMKSDIPSFNFSYRDLCKIIYSVLSAKQLC